MSLQDIHMVVFKQIGNHLPVGNRGRNSCGKNLRQGLDNRDLLAFLSVVQSHLAAYQTSADHDYLFSNLFRVSKSVHTADHLCVVDTRNLRHNRNRASRQHNHISAHVFQLLGGNCFPCMDFYRKQAQFILIPGVQFPYLFFEAVRTAGNQIAAQLITFFIQKNLMPPHGGNPRRFHPGHAAAHNDHLLRLHGRTQRKADFTHSRGIDCTSADGSHAKPVFDCQAADLQRLA